MLSLGSRCRKFDRMICRVPPLWAHHKVQAGKDEHLGRLSLSRLEGCGGGPGGGAGGGLGGGEGSATPLGTPIGMALLGADLKLQMQKVAQKRKPVAPEIEAKADITLN